MMKYQIIVVDGCDFILWKFSSNWNWRKS